MVYVVAAGNVADGVVGGPAVEQGDLLIATVSSPTSAQHWRVLQKGSGGGGGGLALLVYRPPSITEGQVIIPLPAIPGDASKCFMTINSGFYVPTDHFTVSGSDLIWLNAFQLAPTDKIVIYYN